MKKRYIFVVFLVFFVCSPGWSKDTADIENVFKNIPYQEKSMGRRKLVDEDHLLLMQAALKPGQGVPQHDADSNVHILVLAGEVVINLAGKNVNAVQGDLVPVAYKTPMNIKNVSQSDAAFLIIKAPHPAKMSSLLK